MSSNQIVAMRDDFGNENEIVRVKTLPFSAILEKYLPSNTEIDFFSIDVEGYELSVLKSNDWKRFRPRVIVTEIFKNNIDDILHSELYLFLKNKSYKLMCWLTPSLIFIRNE